MGNLSAVCRSVFRFLLRYVYGFASCLYLFTLGLLFARNRAFISGICDRFGLKRCLGRPSPIPAVPLAALVPEEAPVRVCEPLASDGNVTLLELLAIDSLVATCRPSAILEIGTFDGRTTLNLAANAGVHARVYTLDLPKSGMDTTKLPLDHGERRFIAKDESGLRYKGRPESARITQLYGDSATFDFTPYQGAIDLVFVDGSHATPYVRSDSDVAFRLLRDRRGIIIWHDYMGWDGVTTVLAGLYRDRHECRLMKHIEGTSLVVLRLT